MKKIVATAAVLAALVSPAIAADNAAFQAAALKCWNMPPSAKLKGEFVVSAEIDEKGNPIDVTATKYTKDENARAIGQSLARGIERCAPYSLPAGVYTITIDGKALGKKSLEPFKQ